MSAEARLAELGIELPEPPEPVGSYVEAVRTGNLLFLAGHGPVGLDGQLVRGKVGDALDVDAGYQAARLVGLGLLATIRAELGSLDRVSRVVKVFGMVNSPPDFGRHPQVINGVSDLMVEVFGDAGRHARSAVGMGSLPFDIPVEVEMVVEVSD
jgi:enamine deaminase RidA (YjgF/YER057c/UK114 family)